jgi:hypothetical protein
MEMNFREFLAGYAGVTAGYNTAPKIWRMNKDQIMQYWQSLRTGPIQFNPIKPDKKGSTFGEDGIRLTGSRTFIDSVLARLKDIMQYENPHTKLNLIYRQVQQKGIQTPEKSTSFVFYAQAKQRGNNPYPKLPSTPGI